MKVDAIKKVLTPFPHHTKRANETTANRDKENKKNTARRESD